MKFANVTSRGNAGEFDDDEEPELGEKSLRASHSASLYFSGSDDFKMSPLEHSVLLKILPLFLRNDLFLFRTLRSYNIFFSCARLQFLRLKRDVIIIGNYTNYKLVMKQLNVIRLTYQLYATGHC